MAREVANLPGDVPTCHQMLLDLLQTLQHRDLTIEKLAHELAILKRHQFGRKSEKLDVGPLLPFIEEFLKAEAEGKKGEVEVPQEPQAKVEEREGHGRKKNPEHLPRERKTYEVSQEKKRCRGCGKELEKIGEEVTEELEYHPASFFVRQHVREKLACKDCQENVVLAEMPPRPVEKGIPGPGLLAHVLTSKYADHLPLNRQEGIFERHGVQISRSTLCDWVAYSADLLEPLYLEMKAEVLKSKKVHTDDSPVPVLDRDRVTTREGRLWVYVGDQDHPHTVYDFSPNHRSDAPKAFLNGYRGFLQADAYVGYDAVYAGGNIIEIACWAHARRKFFDARGSDRARSHAALAFISRLYEVEREARVLDAGDRKALRQERSRPILESFKRWLDCEASRVLPKSPIGQAVHYALGQWEALTRYIEDGLLEIDNNIAERALRRVALGRKNWLFAGSDEGGRRAAIVYSLVASAKDHRIDPFAYLRDVLERVSTHLARDIAQLLPANWKSFQEGIATGKVPSTAPG